MKKRKSIRTRIRGKSKHRKTIKRRMIGDGNIIGAGGGYDEFMK